MEKYGKIVGTIEKNKSRLGSFFKFFQIFSKKKGFTLVETIIYIAIVSIFFWVALGFFWQMKQAETAGTISREVKENTAQVIELFRQTVRNGEDVNVGVSQFGVNPGSLTLVYSGGNRVFDTYEKSVTIGGLSVDIKKLRLTYGGTSYDLTSDGVNVDPFLLSNFTPGAESNVVQMELQLSNVNPGGDPDYDESLSVHTTANIRQEQ